MINREGTIYQTQSMVLAANGGQQQLIGDVAYVTVLSATYKDDVLISFTGGAFFPIPPGIAISGFVGPVWVKNNNGSANTVVVASGAAELRDNRLVIDSLNPITIASTVADGANVALGAKADAVATTDTGTFSLLAFFKRLLSVGSPSRGSEAHDAPATLAPVLLGMEARATERAAVSASGDVTRLACDLVGKAIVLPYANPENQWAYAAGAAGIVNSTAAVTLKAAGAGVLRNYITSLQITGEALGAATEVAIRDGAGGAVLWRIKIPIGGLPSATFDFPIPLKGTAATLLEVVTLTASVTGGVYVNAQGYVGA